jgi:hypothetical protein
MQNNIASWCKAKEEGIMLVWPISPANMLCLKNQVAVFLYGHGMKTFVSLFCYKYANEYQAFHGSTFSSYQRCWCIASTLNLKFLPLIFTYHCVYISDKGCIYNKLDFNLVLWCHLKCLNSCYINWQVTAFIPHKSD